MSKKEFWIGDKVRIKSSSKEGVYEGKSKDGRARIRRDNKILLIKPQNLELLVIKKPKKTLLESYLNAGDPQSPKEFNPTIDLHIEVLNPDLVNEAPQIILKHQIFRCQEYIDQAISLRLHTVKIIHGKGSGQLKKEVEHLIAMNDSIRFGIPQHDGGATEVWFS